MNRNEILKNFQEMSLNPENINFVRVWKLLHKMWPNCDLLHVIKMSLGGACQTSLGPHIFINAPDQSGQCLPDQSGKCLQDQSGTSYFPYFLRLVIFFYFVIYMPRLRTHIFTITPDKSGKCLSDQSGTNYFHYYPRLVIFFILKYTCLVCELIILVYQWP